MSSSVKLSEKILQDARLSSRVFSRSVAGQIEYWAKIGKIAEDNPNLNYSFIKDILISLEEEKFGKTEEYNLEQ